MLVRTSPRLAEASSARAASPGLNPWREPHKVVFIDCVSGFSPAHTGRSCPPARRCRAGVVFHPLLGCACRAAPCSCPDVASGADPLCCSSCFGVVHPPDAIPLRRPLSLLRERECGFQCFDCQQVEQCCKPFFLPLLRSFRTRDSLCDMLSRLCVRRMWLFRVPLGSLLRSTDSRLSGCSPASPLL